MLGGEDAIAIEADGGAGEYGQPTVRFIGESVDCAFNFFGVKRGNCNRRQICEWFSVPA
jgi:hypothetical protein